MENIAFLPIAPEVILLAGAVLILMAEVTLRMGQRTWAAIAGISLVTSVVFSVLQWLRVDEIGPQLNYSARGIEPVRMPMVVMDHFSAFAGMLLFAVAAVALVGAWKMVRSFDTRGAEFVALYLLAVAGLHMMVMASNLVLVFIGLETASIALYVIAGFTRDKKRSDEAAMKYFLLGSLASAVFLYGVALVFAGTGSTSMYGAASIGEFFSRTVLLEPGIALIGVALIVVGLAFKVTAAPFHQWAPDVYQGAPTGAVGMMAAGVKIAGFATLARILVTAFPALQDQWSIILAGLAALSVVVGTVFAIAQNDLKRMLAYSGVAHAGFILIALVSGVEGIPGMWFYVGTYAFQLVGALAVVAIVSGSRSDRSDLDEYVGLAARAPFPAMLLALFMLGMGGIPFTAGFVAKLGVFAPALDAGFLWLVIVGAVTSVAGLYFYLRVIVLMFFREPETTADEPHSLGVGPGPRLVLIVAGVVTLVLGMVPWPVLEFLANALPL